MTDKSKKEGTVFVPRITQLDANEFDKEIHNVLISQLNEISQYLKPGAFNGVKHELSLILDLLLFYYSVINKNATFGQELLRLKYKDVISKNKLILYALINYVLPYLNSKYESTLFRTQSISIRNLFERVSLFIKICRIINNFLFLREGKYPTITDRLLKLTYSPAAKLSPSVGYNYMTRELLWHGFMELILYLSPLVNYKAMKRKVTAVFLSKKDQVKNLKSVDFDCETKCVICDELPNLPCQISKYCPHVACYYCIKSNLLADEKFMCLQCGETNTAAENLTFLSG